MPLPRVSPAHQLGPVRRVVKGTLAGKMLAAAARFRRKPGRVAAALRAERADPAPPTPTPAAGGRRRFTIVYVLPAGPGSWPALRDTVESILHYDGEDAKVVVADDDSVDCRAAVVRAAFPEVDVVRTRWPTGGPPRQSPFQAQVYAELMRRYDFDVLCKIDTDALMTGAGLGARAAAEFAARPGVGALGSLGVRADGVPADYTYDDWVLAHSRRWSRAVARLQDAARANGYEGPCVHGGVYLISRAALDVAAARGLLRASPPWWTSIGEDLWFSLVVAAAGFRLASWGAPGEPLVSASHHLPLHKEDVLREGKLAVHSVRRGKDGEDEATLRRFFREARAGAAAAT